jgi:biotin synthase
MSTSELRDVLDALETVTDQRDAVSLRPALRLLLDADGGAEHALILRTAYAAKERAVGRNVYLRGLIEFSNVCVKDCLYCGIRRSNHGVVRYTMSKDEIVDAALFAWEERMGSIVLQSGERSDERFVAFVEDVIGTIESLTDGALAITLSLGEQSDETYRRWYDAGARRYLLRIEASDPSLYARLHPAGHDYEQRLRCLSSLREAGYLVGSGVLIGAPGQTIDHLVEDLLFYRRSDLDMIGMGPFVPHRDTPLTAGDPPAARQRRFRLALRMIALTRLLADDVNIAAATALQALHPQGRELALLAGANVVMPVVTSQEYRRHYTLYDDRPCVDESAEQCRGCIDARVASIGETIAYGVAGDPLHGTRRLQH